jgi:integrase
LKPELDSEILECIFEDLQLIKKKLGIEKKQFTTISNYDDVLAQYTEFAKSELNLNDGTIKNHISALKKFLEFTKGVIDEIVVSDYLDSISESNQANTLKALRRFIRDFLKLGNWINDISFKAHKIKMKTNNLPSNNELLLFFTEIEIPQIKIIFLLLFNSGLRINEVLGMQHEKINEKLNCVDVSEIHTGDTKSAWFGFFTNQTADILLDYMNKNYICANVFDVTYDQVYAEFKRVSDKIGIELTPKSLRTVFVEKCIDAKIDKNVIDIFEGRIPKSVQSKIYRNYSPERLKEHYVKVEDLLILGS